MVEHLIFNFPHLLLDELLIAQHIVKLGRNGIDEIKDASCCRTNGQNCKASQGFLLNPTPKPLW